MTKALIKLNAHKGLNLRRFRQDVIDGLNADRQTLVEKIARQEIERVNMILQQDSSIEDKYEAVGNLALIFFALSANNREEASDLFWEACFNDADGNLNDADASQTTENDEPPEPYVDFTTEITEKYKYVYRSVRNIKDISHLQRLVDKIKNYLIPDKVKNGKLST
ncbi:hypothetical protein [Endozoicomonas sp. 4G]|uniref:hypothetical protein n=1 Tax=Endozoicomonas sp. 4G TaxID=2872754 RepID=UPI002078CFC2|nr:hypothetical protein [Endozoicomonas sp. 4G]